MIPHPPSAPPGARRLRRAALVILALAVAAAPLRAQEEIEEKTLMTPGNVAMLLNETGGLPVRIVPLAP